jgi:hypothetical protein
MTLNALCTISEQLLKLSADGLDKREAFGPSAEFKLDDGAPDNLNRTS